QRPPQFATRCNHRPLHRPAHGGPILAHWLVAGRAQFTIRVLWGQYEFASEYGNGCCTLNDIRSTLLC
ncbi:MAG: hypothetical protein KAS81_06930, partial [Anaerolineales bacterium]|nr:hypothetical protein [Anaerolineales bacterium]